jgi:hypothetical protein
VPSRQLYFEILRDLSEEIGITAVGGNMPLQKEYVRDGKRRIIGSVTSGFSDTSAVVRDDDSEIVGRTSERFHTTRDAHGNLISINSPDPGLLINRKR